jgi:hypothetical protein
MQIILDISANTHKNDIQYYMKMVRAITEIDNKKHEIIIKAQLFKKAGNNTPQGYKMFQQMKANTPYPVTASVFDLPSLTWIMEQGELPFIKIANNRDLDWLIGEIPRKIPVYRSIGKDAPDLLWDVVDLLCISKYPATLNNYEKEFGYLGGNNYHHLLYGNISDHTIGLELVKKFQPKIYECHFVLEHDPRNLDGGLWAKTPMQLKEILCM